MSETKSSIPSSGTPEPDEKMIPVQEKPNTGIIEIDIAAPDPHNPSILPEPLAPLIPETGKSVVPVGEVVISQTHKSNDPFLVSTLIPPYSWFFSNPSTAKFFSWLIMGVLWAGLLYARRSSFPGERIFWSHEIILLLSFTFAACTSTWLVEHFCLLRADLHVENQNIRDLLEKQHKELQDWKILLLMPVVVAGIAIGIRVLSNDVVEPFINRDFDYLFSAWLYLGFCFFLYAMVPVARYSRIVRELGEATEKGWLGRGEIRKVAHFYLHSAMLAILLFFFGGMVIFVCHLIYTYGGNPWPGLFIFSGIKATGITEFVTAVYRHDSVIEIAIFLSLYGGIGLGSLIYFLVPQWNVHELLVRRKFIALERAEQALEEAEKQMIGDPCEDSLERYTRRTLMVQAIERMPEWPFDGRGFIGFLVVIMLPAIIVLFKEIILETVVSLLAR